MDCLMHLTTQVKLFTLLFSTFFFRLEDYNQLQKLKLKPSYFAINQYIMFCVSPIATKLSQIVINEKTIS